MNVLSGKKVLITAGPTREYIDPVRYISNDSSGRMGFALASAARKTGARVTLISGPVNPPIPPLKKGGRGGILKGVRRLDVVSAGEMFKAVRRECKDADIIIMAAAVADWRPARCSTRKFKKIPPHPPLKKGGAGGFVAPANHRTIELVQTPDILAWLGAHKRTGQVLVGFALETENLFKNALKKLREKNCDFIVGNYADSIGKESASVLVIGKNGRKKWINRLPKSKAAERLLQITL